jgi:hypothetical protein
MIGQSGGATISSPVRKWNREQVIFCLLTFAISAHFAVSYLSMTTPMVELGSYLKLEVRTPFIYRIFPYFLYRAFDYVVNILHLHLPVLNPPFNSEQNWFMILLTIASMVTAVLFTARSLQRVTGQAQSRWLALLVILCAYFDQTLVLNRNQFYPYDIPSLAAFAGLTFFAISGNYLLFGLWFIPAMLTKETAVFGILLFFLFNFRRDRWRGLTLYCVAMGGLALAIKYLLYRILYHPCPACPILGENHFYYNLTQLVNPLFWVSIASTFAYLWVLLAFLWKKSDRRLKYSFLCVFAVWLLLLFKTTILRELRLFSDLSIPFVVTLGSGIMVWLATFKSAAETRKP